jgi:hypothetical protein
MSREEAKEKNQFMEFNITRRRRSRTFSGREREGREREQN